MPDPVAWWASLPIWLRDFVRGDLPSWLAITDLKASARFGKAAPVAMAAQQQAQLVRRAYHGAHEVGLTYHLTDLDRRLYDSTTVQLDIAMKLADGAKSRMKAQIPIE
jgi:hypothetical protein